MIKRIRPSARSELVIYSADNEYRKQHNLVYGIVKDKWMDTSDFGSYYASDLLSSIGHTAQLGGDHAGTL